MADIATLVGNEVESQTPFRTQVYKATHDGQLRLPFMQRSFISFSYGGKNIEDFNLIAYTSGDRMEKTGYAEFEDLTTTYDTIQGQFYWGTYYHANTLSLTLATDGMTETELDDFKRWFRAGSIRELILAEHPNRAILARVATPPQLHLLGFKQEVSLPFKTGDGDNQQTFYNTYTTVYRGEIDLELIMDEPFWYSIQNILGHQNTLEGYFEESWIDANGQLTTIKDSPDALKIVYEDHIPLGSTTKIDVFLGGDVYASVKYETWARIIGETSKEIYDAIMADSASSEQLKFAYYTTEEWRSVTNPNTGATSSQKVTVYYRGARIFNETKGLGAKIGGAQMTGTDVPAQGIELPFGAKANLYYAGTAPSPVKLRFGMKPQIRQYDATGTGQAFYIITPRNSHSDDTPLYNTISLRASALHEFKFTLPTFWLSYNQVIEIFDNDSIMAPTNAWLTVRETIRDTIRHPVVRAWANMLLDKYDTANGSGIISSAASSARGDLEEGMSLLLCDSSNEPFPAEFTFDAKTGLAIGKFTYRDVNVVLNYTNGQTNGNSWRELLNNAANSNENYMITQEENVGDMVRSQYLILDERNVLDGNYQVQAWEEAHPDYAYLITHDVPNGLQDLHFEFKNMYL